mmetsp:Transcript_35974/g.85748  ORF Transcript_35974/g.85748 Transcript_35974/m.85748 type:complete len:491 (-) Transcript_35974:22-1494(-)
MAIMMSGRKGVTGASSGGSKRTRAKLDLGYGDDDDELDDEDEDSEDEGESSEEESEEEETVDAKRLRLAKDYLGKIEAQDSSDSDGSSAATDSDTDDKVGKRILKERLKSTGLLQTCIAESVSRGIQEMKATIEASDSAEELAKSWIDKKYVTYHRGHDLTPTCVALSREGHHAFSGSKDGSLIMWDVEEGRKMTTILSSKRADNQSQYARNERELLALAASDDGRYLATAGRDKCVRVFDIRTLGNTDTASPVTIFEGHKKAVTALAFRSRTMDLYSGSEDRCIRRYDLGAMTYVETLYGHQSAVVGMDCANKNRPVSIARDRTVRVWKVEEDSHFVFRPGGDVGSADCISAIQDGWFVTGHDDGRLALWREEKKRPVGDVITAAHGYEGTSDGSKRSVVCCDGVAMSDVLATGSNDGHLRLWKVSTGECAGINPLESIPMHGHVNDVAVGPEGRFCVAAVGQEPRLGRWDRVARAKNRFAIIRLRNEL